MFLRSWLYLKIYWKLCIFSSETCSCIPISGSSQIFRILSVNFRVRNPALGTDVTGTGSQEGKRFWRKRDLGISGVCRIAGSQGVSLGRVFISLTPVPLNALNSQKSRRINRARIFLCLRASCICLQCWWWHLAFRKWLFSFSWLSSLFLVQFPPVRLYSVWGYDREIDSMALIFWLNGFKNSSKNISEAVGYKAFPTAFSISIWSVKLINL